jgi:hypothetical protein
MTGYKLLLESVMDYGTCEDSMQRFYRFGLFLILFGVGFSIEVSAFQMNDYMPLSKAELGRPFPLKFIGVYDHKNSVTRIAIGAGGAEVDAGEEEQNGALVLSGKDKAGKPWAVNFGAKAGFGGNLFTADLDKNGFRDFLMIFPTAGNGLAPSSHVLTLLFDAQGRPVPFEAEGYYDTELKSLPELVDMNCNGRAELVFMNFDDGYWITNIYEAGNARWQRVKGRVGNRAFPLFTRFTHRPNHRAVTPARGRHPRSPDLSNQKPVTEGRIVAFKWAKEGGDDAQAATDGMFFVVVNSQGEQLSWVADDWYGSLALIIDTREGRQVISLGTNRERIKKIFDELISRDARVRLFGRRFADKTSPELIWATHSK